jgi:hypothetical protein
MLKYQSPFLNAEGLTSTSANHIANIAKEYYSNLEEKLNSIVLYTTTFRLISDTNITTLEEGDTKEFIEEIPSILNKITQAKSLIAWLREGIKVKDNFLKDITNMHFEDYLLLKDETLEVPIMGNILTETEYYNSLSI